jgi:hypothetical protein
MDSKQPYYPLEKILGADVYKLLSPDTIAEMQLYHNKILWANQTLGWSTYNGERKFEQFYQRETILCSAKLKAIRMGRRMGKCLEKNSVITTWNRGPVKIKDLKQDDVLITFDEQTGKLHSTAFWNKEDNGIKECLQIKTKLGKKDTVTTNHPYYVIRNGMPEWIDANRLQIGDRIAIPKKYQNVFNDFESEEENRELYRLIGYLLSDGGTNYRHSNRFTNFDASIIKDMNHLLKLFNCRLKRYSKGQYGIIIKDKMQKENIVNQISKDYDLKHLAIHKQIPEQVFRTSKKNIAHMISAMWDCDGWVNKTEKGIQIGYCSSSLKMIEGLKHLLMRFGIHPSYKLRKVKYKNSYKYSYQLMINDVKDAKTFYEHFDLILKSNKLKNILKNKSGAISNVRTFPKTMNLFLRSKIHSHSFSQKKIGIRLRNEYSPSIEKIEKINNIIKDKDITHLLNSDILFDEIVSIKNVGEQQTYTISVGGTNTFITNDIITHNSESLIIEAINYGVMHPGSNVLIIGPFQNLIDELFDRMDKILGSDKSIFSGQYSRSRRPFNKIELNNGSIIKGFTTGTDGDSIRGQSADIVFFDEAAYIPPAAFRAIMAFLIDKPGVRMMATSTPSAIETNFKKWCNEDDEWKDFHYPSTILPYFKDIEKTLRNTYTGDDYGLEVEAEFIEGSAKVFKNDDIEASLQEYKYINSRAELSNPNDWIISIGADWNEFKNGIQIVVLGFNIKESGDKPFKVLKRISLHNPTNGDKLKNLQTMGVRTIQDLYHAFNANYVYVDEGHGSMQNEMLSAYFFKIGKPRVFKGINFSSAYEFEDIYTNEVKRKRTKVMMVYFLQKRFELREIIMSVTEEPKEAKNLLTDQLKNYIIAKFDSKEEPVFGGEDHIIDGLLLACFAIIENSPGIFDQRTGNIVATINRSYAKQYSNEDIEAPIKVSNSSMLSFPPPIENYSNVDNHVTTISKYTKRKNRRRGGTEFEIF